jgi:hypothetical protein
MREVNLSIEGSYALFLVYRAELRLPVFIIRVGAGLIIWEVNCVAFEFEHFPKKPLYVDKSHVRKSVSLTRPFIAS